MSATRARLAGLLEGIREGRFQRGTALLAAHFALYSGVQAYLEHRRGSFNQRWMWTPILLTPPLVAAAVGAAASERAARTVLPGASGAMLLDGLLGFLLHLRGVRRMPGHTRNLTFNIIAGPPLFAPLLFSVAGLLGLTATLFRRERL